MALETEHDPHRFPPSNGPSTVEEAKCSGKLLKAQEPDQAGARSETACSAEDDDVGKDEEKKRLDAPPATLDRQVSDQFMQSVEEMVVPPAEDIH